VTGRLRLGAPVALLIDAPEHGLGRGHVGALVSLLSETEWLVDFSDREGRSYALAPVAEPDQRMLFFDPPTAA
jgi:hypothetical protein